MKPILHVSDAASLGMHATVLLAREPGLARSVPQLAAALDVSADHLSKVMQRLAKAGLVAGGRGRTGGYALAKPAGDIRLLDVVEALEGPIDAPGCLLGKPLCRGTCLFGDLVDSITRQVRERLAALTVADAAGPPPP